MISPELPIFTRQENLAYAAGLFDGEGCIQIFKTAAGHYGFVAKVAMTNKAPLLFLQQEFGGSVNVRPVRDSKNGPRKQQWDWCVHHKEGEAFLEEILPCLRVKDYEAVIALIFLSSLKSTKDSGVAVPEPVKELRELLLQECKAAKKWSEQA